MAAAAEPHDFALNARATDAGKRRARRAEGYGELVCAPVREAQAAARMTLQISKLGKCCGEAVLQETAAAMAMRVEAALSPPALLTWRAAAAASELRPFEARGDFAVAGAPSAAVAGR